MFDTKLNNSEFIWVQGDYRTGPEKDMKAHTQLDLTWTQLRIEEATAKFSDNLCSIDYIWDSSGGSIITES